jgi:uncharacterized protein (DUF305 family)
MTAPEASAVRLPDSMMTLDSTTGRLLAPALLCIGLTACATTPASQGATHTAPTAAAAPASSTVTSAPKPAALPMPALRDTVRQGYTAADVRFMQQMIHHHAQAVRMSALVPARSTRADVRSLAERIDASQQAEIEMMRHWLAERHELVPDPSMPRAVHDSIMGGMHGMGGMHDAHDAPDAPNAPGPPDTSTMLMPGMLTPAEMDALAAATGPAFDRLFLEGMIRHHQGALTMVAALLASPGGAEEPQIFGFASDVDSGQRAEIRRMQAILATMSNAASPR